VQYDDTQANLKLTLQRNLYGLHAPVRHLMEREIVSAVRALALARR
jgi:proteasome maturation protein